MRKSIATVSLSGSLTEKLSAASAAGFDGIELFENDLLASPLSPKDIRLLAEDLGLRIELYQPFRDAEALPADAFARVLRRAEQKFAVMEQLGAPMLLVCSTVSAQAVDDDLLAAEQLRTLAERASEHGVRIAYEALAWGRHVSDYRHSWRIVEAADHPSLGVCLDSFHILTLGDDPAGIREIPAEKLFFLQLADAPDLDMEPLHFSRHYRCFPGQGVFDLTGFTEHVLAAGYEGPLSLEVFNDVFRRTDAERTAVDAMRSLIVLGDAVRHRLPERVGLDPLPPVSPSQGFAFAEITVDTRSETQVRGMLAGLGFTLRGVHRTKPVQLWQQGDARLVVNRAHFNGTDRERGDAFVSVIGVETADPRSAAARADALLAPPAPRAIGAGESRLPALIAPDGSNLYFCRTAADDGWLADFAPLRDGSGAPVLDAIDHIALSPHADHYDETVLFYRAAFGLALRSNEEIASPHGLVRSRAIADDHLRLIFNVPVLLDDAAPRLQHVAFSCTDIFAAAAHLRTADVPLLPIPGNYYEDLAARTDLPASTLTTMRDHGILYDRSGEAEFFHLYTTTAGRSLFFEVVQRVGSYTGYGAPNAPIRRAAQHL
ncbi:4-hydroxyphenylpyruvate dioxygenase [Actinocorallia herbida]|uniref:3-dehydroshikimate dehydratase n=1 Tax=Actinocorallia herbida TaxID=58109 RepID=A0A3N1D282_9ACTN|nr:sugar phosphate isomerase/epimerase and 4-hydroxyphenylpyruvate domain-containing protein [Actinocorallia herbida]ROO87188.1 4-hydroxyphenylpyruvate dioxygenase [Actinocorallia herbida]